MHTDEPCHVHCTLCTLCRFGLSVDQARDCFGSHFLEYSIPGYRDSQELIGLFSELSLKESTLETVKFQLFKFWLRTRKAGNGFNRMPFVNFVLNSGNGQKRVHFLFWDISRESRKSWIQRFQKWPLGTVNLRRMSQK